MKERGGASVSWATTGPGADGAKAILCVMLPLALSKGVDIMVSVIVCATVVILWLLRGEAREEPEEESADERERRTDSTGAT